MLEVSLRSSVNATISPNSAASLPVVKGACSVTGDHVDWLPAIVNPPCLVAYFDVLIKALKSPLAR
jgi:hypothetical protein